MFNLTLLSAFIPTFFLVSITPGMCMTLALSLGITLGVRRTLWMMLGELAGVALVAVAAVAGVAAVMLHYPALFTAFKLAGGLYLLWLGLQLWRSRGRMAMADAGPAAAGASRLQLATQGFVTAAANPKGWAFDIALLPPFIDPELALAPQLGGLLAIILVLEFVSLLLYANGGRTVGRLLQQGRHVRTLNRVAGTLMIGVAIWLALG